MVKYIITSFYLLTGNISSWLGEDARESGPFVPSEKPGHRVLSVSFVIVELG